MKDFEEKGKLDNNNYKDFYQQCVSEFKQLTLNEDLLKDKGPDGLDIKPANCSEFEIEGKDSSIVKNLQKKLKFLINIADASNKKFTLKINDKLVKNIKEDLDLKNIKSITYTYNSPDNKVIEFNTSN